MYCKLHYYNDYNSIASSSQMNPIILMFLLSVLAKARTRRDRMKVSMVIMTLMLQQQVPHANRLINAVNIRRMATMVCSHGADSDTLAVHLLAMLREDPSVHFLASLQCSPFPCVSIRKARRSWWSAELTFELANFRCCEKQFRPTSQVSCLAKFPWPALWLGNEIYK